MCYEYLLCWPIFIIIIIYSSYWRLLHYWNGKNNNYDTDRCSRRNGHHWPKGHPTRPTNPSLARSFTRWRAVCLGPMNTTTNNTVHSCLYPIQITTKRNCYSSANCLCVCPQLKKCPLSPNSNNVSALRCVNRSRSNTNKWSHQCNNCNLLLYPNLYLSGNICCCCCCCFFATNISVQLGGSGAKRA